MGNPLFLVTFSCHDQRNLLTSVVEKSNGTTVNYTLTYTYDVLGERVQQSEWTSGGSTVTTRSAYSDAQTMWATLNTSNVVQERYLWGTSGTQMLVQVNVGAASLSFALTDHLGSVRDLTDGSSVLDHVEYRAFDSVTSQTSAASGSGFGYTCLWQDVTAGLVNADKRTFSVSTHQWMQEDPITISGGQANFRAYVNNDAADRRDPTGLYSIVAVGISTWAGVNNVDALIDQRPKAWYVGSELSVESDSRKDISDGLFGFCGLTIDAGGDAGHYRIIVQMSAAESKSSITKDSVGGFFQGDTRYRFPYISTFNQAKLGPQNRQYTEDLNLDANETETIMGWFPSVTMNGRPKPAEDSLNASITIIGISYWKGRGPIPDPIPNPDPNLVGDKPTNPLLPFIDLKVRGA